MQPILKHALQEIYPLLIILCLHILNYISFFSLIIIYLLYCLYNRLTLTISVKYNTSNITLNNILANCPSILKPNYKPHFFLSNSILQLFALNFTSNYKYPKEYTENIQYEPVENTGIHVVYYSYKEIPTNKSNPILILFPGLTGNHTDTYAKNIIHEAILNGFQIIIYQMRVLTNINNIHFNKANETYNLFEDVAIAMNYLHNKHKTNSFYAIGCSFGALQLTGYLGSEYNLKDKFIKAAVSLSNPYDVLTSSKICKDTIYDDYLLWNLRTNFIKNFLDCNKSLTKYQININKIMQCDDLHTFDMEFTRKVQGYAHADDYYRNISVTKNIKNISIPILFIHAMDDNITTPRAIPYDDIENNINSVSIWVSKGAHLCYIEQGKGLFELKQWVSTPAVEFVKAASRLN